MSFFTLPDVGEGLVEADIVAWKVAPGDVVEINQILVEIETAKSLVELPSPFAGPVAELLVAEGDTVAVGTQIIRFDTADTAPEAPAGSGDQPGASSGNQPGSGAPASSEASAGGVGEAKFLVGYGVSETPKTTVQLRGKRSNDAPAQAAAAQAVQSAPPAAAPAESPQRPRATPPVRAFAKKNSIALEDVTGTGPHGRVLRSDLDQHLRNPAAAAAGGAGAVTGASAAAVPDQTGTGAIREERTPLKGVRKAIAQAMVRSYSEIPHAAVTTEFDMTPTMDLLDELKSRREYDGRKLTPLLFVAKAVIRAVKRNPRINTLLDGEEVVQRHYVNLGIAAATPRGLIVPHIKDAHTMTLMQLEAAITDLVTTARAGKTAPTDQVGGTITITNAGLFGVDSGMPIINPGEPAIVGMGAIREKAWVVDGQIVPRMVSNIGVTVDHRIIDGDVAGYFLSDVVDALTDPRMLGIE